jgi:hypothetical protein
VAGEPQASGRRSSPRWQSPGSPWRFAFCGQLTNGPRHPQMKHQPSLRRCLPDRRWFPRAPPRQVRESPQRPVERSPAGRSLCVLGSGLLRLPRDRTAIRRGSVASRCRSSPRRQLPRAHGVRTSALGRTPATCGSPARRAGGALASGAGHRGVAGVAQSAHQ